MTPDEYVTLAIKTENRDWANIFARFENVKFARLDHASKGMITEVGEFTDELKKYEIYGKNLDETNLIEELGDLMWYVAIACDAVGVSLEEVMEKNIAKLKARYGEKFNEEGALNRNLENERALLEDNYLDSEGGIRELAQLGTKQEIGAPIHYYLPHNNKTLCGLNVTTDNITNLIVKTSCVNCLRVYKDS